MITLTKKEFFITLQQLVCIFLAIYWLKPGPQTNNSTYQIEQLLIEKQNLQKKIDSLAKVNEVTEKKLKQKIADDEQKYLTIIRDLEIKFIKEKNRLKKLTFDEHVVLLDDNLSSVGDTVKVQKLDGDTTILITPNQMRFMNETFLFYSQTLFHLNEQTIYLEKLNENLNSSLLLLDAKKLEIEQFKTQLQNGQNINQQLNNIIKDNKKNCRKKNVQSMLWGGLIGGGLVTTQLILR